MNNRLMIRLIDVGLLILLGFIAISRLKTEYIELPSTGESSPQQFIPHEASLHIYQNLFQLEDRGQSWNCKTLDELENMLVDQNSRYQSRQVKLIVTIQPHRASIMQNLVDVMDICQRNHIEKNLSYESNN